MRLLCLQELHPGLYPAPVQREGDHRRTAGVDPQPAVPDPHDGGNPGGDRGGPPAGLPEGILRAV